MSPPLIVAVAVAVLAQGALAADAPIEACTIDQPHSDLAQRPAAELFARCKPVPRGAHLSPAKHHLFMVPNLGLTTTQWRGGTDCRGMVHLGRSEGPTPFDDRPAYRRGSAVVVQETDGRPVDQAPKHYWLLWCDTGLISTEAFEATFTMASDRAKEAAAAVEAERQGCDAKTDPPIFAPDTPKTAASALAVAKQALLAGDLVRAADAVNAGLGVDSKNVELNLFGAALFSEVTPDRAKALETAAQVVLPPFPTLPPSTPAKAGGPAFVNVASAAVRAAPTETAKLSTRLRIGTPVKVLQASGEFLKVSFSSKETRVNAGFIHKDLLSASQPTIASILAEAGRTSDPDARATLFWRALNLDPARADVFESLVRLAVDHRRYGLAVDAVNEATRAGRWPVPAPQTKFKTAGEARLFLYRVSVTRSVEAMRALLAPFEKQIRVTNYDGAKVKLADYYARAMERGELWPSLRAAVLNGSLTDEAYTSSPPGSLVIKYGCDGWVLGTFDLAGGFSEQECVNGCNESEGSPEK